MKGRAMGILGSITAFLFGAVVAVLLSPRFVKWFDKGQKYFEGDDIDE